MYSWNMCYKFDFSMVKVNIPLADCIYNKPTIETDRLIIRTIVFSDVPASKGHLEK